MRRKTLTRRKRLDAFVALVFANAGRSVDLTRGEEVAVIQHALPDTPRHVCVHVRNVVEHVWHVPRLFPLFTELVQKLMAVSDSRVACHNDVDMWSAPSECHDDVRRSHDAGIKALLKEYCATPEFVYGEARRRGLSDKWMYDNFPQIEFEE